MRIRWSMVGLLSLFCASCATTNVPALGYVDVCYRITEQGPRRFADAIAFRNTATFNAAFGSDTTMLAADVGWGQFERQWEGKSGGPMANWVTWAQADADSVRVSFQGGFSNWWSWAHFDGDAIWGERHVLQ